MEDKNRQELFGGWGGGEGGPRRGSVAGRVREGVQPQQQVTTVKVDLAGRDRALRETQETLEVGRNTLSTLQGQQEQLEHSEMVVDSTQYLVDKSAQVLRGMTFWGKISNLFREEVAVRQRPERTAGYQGSSRAERGLSHGQHSPPPAVREGFICPLCKKSLGSDELLLRHHAACQGPGGNNEEARGELFSGRKENGSSRDLGGGLVAEQKRIMQAQEAYIDSLTPAVQELGIISRGMKDSIAQQGEVLVRLTDKTEAAQDGTMAVTRKAARQTQSSQRKKATFVRAVALRHTTTKLFLSVEGQDVVLLDAQIRSTSRWECYEKQLGQYGFKNEVSGLWLGQGLFGGVVCSGKAFKKWEEWQLQTTDLTHPTQLICCCSNWGEGGYVYVKGLGHNADGKAKLGISKSTDKECKNRAALFQLVDLENYSASPYAAGVSFPVPPQEQQQQPRQQQRPI
ncbi:unnamed protein product [Chrysoparadoxa australica]